ERIGFLGVGVIVVVFGVRAWMKNNRWYNRYVWAAFALVTLFFNMSFSLAGTRAQTIQAELVVTESSDSVLAALRSQRQDAAENLALLNSQYDEAVREGTVEALRADITAATATRDSLDARIIERLTAIDA